VAVIICERVLGSGCDPAGAWHTKIQHGLNGRQPLRTTAFGAK
jgi:hypothetical protein